MLWKERREWGAFTYKLYRTSTRSIGKYDLVLMPEGAVYDERGNTWVMHALWDARDSPKEATSHYGYDLERWIEHLGADVDKIWVKGAKKTLLNAKIFPGISANAFRGMVADSLDSEILKATRNLRDSDTSGRMPTE